MRHPIAWVILVALVAGCAGLIWELQEMEVVRRAWAVLLAEPAMGSVWILSIWVAVASTCLSVIAARTLAAWLWRRPNREWISILLAVPHGAVALGLLWLMAPSGLLMRWLAIPLDVLSPPDWAFPQDTWGIGLILALTVKETLFLTVMAFAVLARLSFHSQALHAASLGWSADRFFLQSLWPQILPRLSAPILVVLAFGLTNLELTVIMSPDIPGMIGPRLYALFTDADPIRRAAGALGSLLMFLVSLVLSGLCLGMLQGFAQTQRRRLEHRAPSMGWFRGLKAMLCFGGLIWILIGVVLALWAVAGSWSFQMALPVFDWDRLPQRMLRMQAATLDTLRVGVMTAICAVVGAIWVLEGMARRHESTPSLFWWGLLWMPALPLSAGLLSVWLILGGQPGFWAVLFAHWLIACPYALIVLAGPWLARSVWERQVLQMSGINDWTALRRVWIPKHRSAILLAFAVAFSVSCALYTQTLMLGGGRVETLATELVVTMQSDRRLAALAGFANTLLPAALFGCAVWFGHRRRWNARLS